MGIPCDLGRSCRQIKFPKRELYSSNDCLTRIIEEASKLQERKARDAIVQIICVDVIKVFFCTSSNSVGLCFLITNAKFDLDSTNKLPMIHHRSVDAFTSLRNLIKQSLGSTLATLLHEYRIHLDCHSANQPTNIALPYVPD